MEKRKSAARSGLLLLLTMALVLNNFIFLGDVQAATPTIIASANLMRNGSGAFTTGTEIWVGYSTSATNVNKAALKFDLSSVSGVITGATLKIYINQIVGSPFMELYGSGDDTWSTDLPSGIYQLIQGQTNVTVSDIWMTFDVTNFIKDQQAGDSVASFIITGAAGCGPCSDTLFSFNSIEVDGKEPQLELVTNEAPTSIALTSNQVAENSPSGTVVGTLSATDTDLGETFTFSLVGGDTSDFAINGNNLETSGSFDFETKASYDITIRATDAAGNTHDKNLSIHVTDVNEPPQGSIQIQNGDAVIGTTSVTLNVYASDPEFDALQMQFSNDNITWSDWEVFASTKNWTLSAGDGTKTVYMQVKDAGGNVSSTIQDSIVVQDNAAPVIALNGSNPMTVEANSVFTDPGATAQDLQDGDISASIMVTGTVDTTTLGTYLLDYNVSDTAGNVAVTVTRTVYVKDTQPPILLLLGDSEMRVPFGAAFTDPGAQATDVYYGDISGLIVVTGTVDTSQAGDYTLRYNVQDPSGNAAAEVTRTVKVAQQETGDSGDSSGGWNATSKPFIDKNGIMLDPSAIDTTKPSITLEVTPKNNVAYVSIPVSILTSMEGKNAAFFIEIKTPYGSYQVPVDLASLIPGLTDLLAANNLKTDDISFKITLADKTGDKDIQEAFAADLPDGIVLGAIVNFHIDIINAKTGKAIGTADQFSKALTRVIPLPKNITGMPEQWGAFRYNETIGKFEFVPAQAVQIGDVWYAMIRSYSNSVYVTVQNQVSFADVQKHWGEPYIQLAAAKGLVEGVGGGRFAPDKSVTRAEFAAMLVRALGRGDSAGSTAPYSDVKQDAWYFDAVVKAKELGLLDFVSGTRFKPDQPLTREEMASMLAAVIALEKLPITKENVNLNGYRDIAIVDAAYLEDVRLMVKLNIMTGTSEDTFSPKGETTRAQTAVVFIRTLQALGMID